MRKKYFGNRGFTLMEMLIVVAIIAVLVAIAIPVFSGSLEKSRKAACQANCRSLYAVLSTNYLLEDITAEEIGTVSLSKESNYAYDGGRYECPSGGRIYGLFTDGRIFVRCSYHDDGEGNPSAAGKNAWEDGTAEKVWDTLSGFNVSIDSTSVDGQNKKAFLDSLAEKGVDINRLGAVSWKYAPSASGNFFEWTTADIATLNPGDTFTVVRYRLDGDYEGQYTVWKGKVNKNKDGINVILSYGNELSADLTPEQKKDAANVIPVYNENCGDYSQIQ